MATGDFYGSVGDIVDERTVVADQHHCAAALGKKCFQPAYALNVKVVGGLIEKQHIGMAQQDLGQFNAHAPTAGEFARGTIKVAALKAKAHKRALHLSLIILTTHHHETVMLKSETVHKGHVVGAVIVGAVGHFLLHAVKAALHLHVIGKSLARLLTHRRVVGDLHYLRKVAYRGVIWYGHHSR